MVGELFYILQSPAFSSASQKLLAYAMTILLTIYGHTAEG